MSLRVINGGASKGPTNISKKAANDDTPAALIDALGMADYIWQGSSGEIFSKRRPIVVVKGGSVRDASDKVPIIPPWSFTTKYNRHVMLLADHYVPDPFTSGPCYIVLCEPKSIEDTIPVPNSRAALREAIQQAGGRDDEDRFFSRWGFKQSYDLRSASVPDSYANTKDAFRISDIHFGYCLAAGLLTHSASSDPKKDHYFKIGERYLPEAIDPDPATALRVCDHLIIARYLLEKIAIEHGYVVEWAVPKVYLSTMQTRDVGKRSIQELDALLSPVTANFVPGLRMVMNTDQGKILPVSDFCVISPMGKCLDPYRIVETLMVALISKDVDECEEK